MPNLQENGSVYVEAEAGHGEWETSGHPISPGVDSPKHVNHRRPKAQSHLHTGAAFSIPHTYLVSPLLHSERSGFYRGQWVLLTGVLPSSSSHLTAISPHRDTLHPDTIPCPTYRPFSLKTHPHICALPPKSTADLLTPGKSYSSY